MKKFTHIIITRFSVRLDGTSVLRDRGYDWLYSSHRLDLRMLLFEHVALASVRGSSVHPDCHLVVIDEALPEAYKQRLEILEKSNSFMQLVTWDTHWDFLQLGWVKSVFPVETPFVVTTVLDDDDAISRTLLERIESHCHQHLKGNSLKGWRWIGSKRALEWDLDLSETPFGYLKPYAGGTAYWQGVGTALLVPNHVNAPTVYGWTHDWIQRVFGKLTWRWNPKLLRRRLSLLRRFNESNRVWALISLLWKSWTEDVEPDVNHEFDMLITNNGSNLQDARLALGAANRDSRGIQIRLEPFGIQTEFLQHLNSSESGN